MSRIAYVNGLYVPHREASVHIEDRGYQFSDGVYEVFAVRNGKLIGEQGHMDRLDHSLKALQIDWPMKRGPFMIVCREVMRRNHVKDGLIYLQVTRGVAPRNHQFPEICSSAFVVTAKKAPPVDRDVLLKGVSVISIPDIRWLRHDIKSVSLLPNILGKQQAKEADAVEAWQVDDDGFVTEGTSSNAWIVTKEGELVTRKAGFEILNGITRLGVLEACEEAGIKFVERAFTMDEAYQSKEAFLTSSTSHVKAITQIDGKPVGNGQAGETTSKLLDCFIDYIDTHGGPSKTDTWN